MNFCGRQSTEPQGTVLRGREGWVTVTGKVGGGSVCWVMRVDVILSAMVNAVYMYSTASAFSSIGGNSLTNNLLLN
jgi:hypothetical protein